MRILKKLIIWGVIAGVVYGMFSYHFIFVGSSLKLLKKSNPSMNYTIFSTASKTNESILAIDELRDDGIGQILVQAGKLSQEDLERLTNKILASKEKNR
jgi:hypothetical protein